MGLTATQVHGQIDGGVKKMTKDNIISMARESGLVMYDYSDPSLERFANLIAEVEREACAKLCEEMAKWHSDLVTAAYETAADAIRARGQHD